MSYRVSFSERDDVLVARVVGTRSVFVDEFLADTQAAWHRIAEHCIATQAAGVAVLWDVTGPLSTDKASRVGRLFGDPAWPRHVRIAYVERDPDVLRISALGIKLAAAAGYVVRGFPTEADALQWLRQPQR